MRKCITHSLFNRMRYAKRIDIYRKSIFTLLLYMSPPWMLFIQVLHQFLHQFFHIQSNIKTRLITATDKSSHKNAVIYISLFARFISSYSISRRPSPMYFSSQASQNTLHHPPAAPLKLPHIRTLSGLSLGLHD